MNIKQEVNFKEETTQTIGKVLDELPDLITDYYCNIFGIRRKVFNDLRNQIKKIIEREEIITIPSEDDMYSLLLRGSVTFIDEYKLREVVGKIATERQRIMLIEYLSNNPVELSKFFAETDDYLNNKKGKIL